MKYTDNVRFNIKFSIIYLFLVLLYLPLNLWFYSLISSFIFIFSSAFFQPDLDLDNKRPGYSSFPLGNKLKNTNYGEKIFFILLPLNKLWHYLWAPYGFLMTHRGISHYPIVGTLTRIGYLYLIALFINFFIKLDFYLLDLFFSKNFIPNEKNHIQWVIICLPIFLSDIIHFLVDFYDSIKNGTRFQSYAHKPGFFLELINPGIQKYHKKALKKAKSNKKKNKKSNR